MVKYVVLFRKRPEWDREAFLRYWREEHVPLIARLPGLRRYVISPAVPVEGYPPAYDGMAELWFDSAEAALAALGAPQGAAARADTQKFADPASILRFFAQEELVSWQDTRRRDP